MNNNIQKTNTSNYLIVDWGTSNLRIFLMSHDDQLIKKTESAMGLLRVENADFAAALEKILSPWLLNFKKLPVFMAGMVGSVNGWHSVDYVETYVNVAKLSQRSFHFELPWLAPATIISGVLHVDKSKKTKDVMRGEEVQVFGLVEKYYSDIFVKELNNNTYASNLNIILPGTHSKHVKVVNKTITELSSFMTGELFSVISQHTILGKDLPPQQFNTDAFDLGVREGQTTQLTQMLFQTRTHKLFNSIGATYIKSYLSGLLIGNELQLVKKQHTFLIGSPNLCSKYQLACEALAIPVTIVDGDDCFLAGMVKLKQNITSRNNC
ncbi:2-dehydro-3-deoxygalactonokinase [Aliiglaciecola sp. 3_MG-2023]|uniref:2-dehydro-3-deoxygalactonokinase n=1 Tax=Aliiglaciecola sp. 3_MG-2023 TaxID=3062644 RepID=UPI0026E2557E|nr:2-dehydro-3-deoxygalactonokinase [Aliiglaciecola sp. 3_MG-2023]MDO6693894.1 2-dehydro-3-deoxygalactonokinase [Aliiglaciecola sp. 3_MG-2023]